ncbi:sigma-54 interaction domain-containing protein [Cupriavidus necator]
MPSTSAPPPYSPLADHQGVLRRAMQSLFSEFDALSEGTVIVDADARVVWINQRYAARWGFSDPQQAIGRHCEEVIPNTLMRQVVETGRPILLDLMESEQEPQVVTRLPLKDDDGRVIGAVGFALFNGLQGLTPLLARLAQAQSELAATQRSLARLRRAKYSFASIVGSSKPALEAKRHARLAAQANAPVLLLGETGTGKELLAHAIHGASARASQPLVSVNVAAIPETLLEVEFFGAAPGAYTGVDRKGRVGKFQLADGGTLFLDEIGDMPLPLQSKLLRVLQDQEIEPLGSNQLVRTDVRIIAATSTDLPALVAAGRFRADLWYRLNVLAIHVPPLRARLDDLGALAHAIIDEIAGEHAGRPLELTEDAVRLLHHYHWPGNVRELRNVLERAVMLSGTCRLDAAALRAFLPFEVDEDLSAVNAAPAPMAGSPARYDEALATFERQFFAQALEAAGGQVSQAAKRIGMSRATLYRKLAALGMRVDATEAG